MQGKVSFFANSREGLRARQSLHLTNDADTKINVNKQIISRLTGFLSIAQETRSIDINNILPYKNLRVLFLDIFP